MQRYFGKEKKENNMILEPGDMHHIKKVMRMKDGDEIEVVIDGKLYLCNLKNNLETILIKKELEIPKDFMKYITLVIPVLKEQKMDLILQKATELGVTEIIPVSMKRSMVKIGEKEEKKLERWNKIMKEASEQSMRNCIPKLQSVTTFSEITKLEGLKIICSTREKENTFKKLLQTSTNYDKLIIVIGPEGGLDIEEEKLLEKYNFIPVTLGPRIMRVETVPIYVLSVLNYEYME